LETRVIAILDSQRARLPLSPWAAIAGSVLVAFTVALSTAAQLQGEDKAPGANEANLPPQGDRAHANDTKPGTDPQTLPQIETQTTRVTRLERQLALINGLHPEELSGEQLRPLHIDDPKIAMLLSRLQTVVEERKSLVESEHLHTLKSGAEDPVVKALKAQRVAISQELGRLLPLIHDSLSSELRSEKENLDKMGVVAKKAAAIIIPQVEFREATLEESVEWLTKKSRELSPNGQPVNILLDPSPDAVAAKITLSLKNVSLLEAARYVAALANIPLEIQPNALALGSTPPPTTLVTKEWAVLPGMFGTDPSPARDWLTAHGVKFGAGTSALYVSATRRLIMRNTQDEMGRVDELIAAANAAQPQAKSGEARAAAAAVPAPAVENPLLSKAAKIIIPKIELHDATVAEVIDLLRAKATQFDPDKRGVNIVLKHGPDAGVKIAMSLSNIPLIEALRYVAGLSNLELHAEPDAIVLQPSGGPRSEAKPAAAPSAAEVVPIKPAVRNAFKEGDSIEISAITGSSSTFRVGGTYRVQGICRQNTVRNASLYLGNTAEGSADAIQPAAGTSLFIPAPKGSTEEFVFTITLLRPGRLHVTLYDLDNHDPKDNAYAGLDLGEVAP